MKVYAPPYMKKRKVFECLTPSPSSQVILQFYHLCVNIVGHFSEQTLKNQKSNFCYIKKLTGVYISRKSIPTPTIFVLKGMVKISYLIGLSSFLFRISRCFGSMPNFGYIWWNKKFKLPSRQFVSFSSNFEPIFSSHLYRMSFLSNNGWFNSCGPFILKKSYPLFPSFPPT